MRELNEAENHVLKLADELLEAYCALTPMDMRDRDNVARDVQRIKASVAARAAIYD